jgi:hypothetical protein
MAVGDARDPTHHERRTFPNGMTARRCLMSAPLRRLIGIVGLLIWLASPHAQAVCPVLMPAVRGRKPLPGGRWIPIGPNRSLDGCGDDELVPFGEKLEAKIETVRTPESRI